MAFGFNLDSYSISIDTYSSFTLFYPRPTKKH
jgi:hypothetical protein